METKQLEIGNNLLFLDSVPDEIVFLTAQNSRSQITQLLNQLKVNAVSHNDYTPIPLVGIASDAGLTAHTLYQAFNNSQTLKVTSFFAVAHALGFKTCTFTFDKSQPHQQNLFGYGKTL